MSYIQYTICCNPTYYYIRRVPKHAVKQYGQFIRYSLGKCSDLAAKIAHRLSVLLQNTWAEKLIVLKLILKQQSLPINQSRIHFLHP